MSDTFTPSMEVHGLIMRSRAQQLYCQVNSFLYSSSNDLENRLLPNDLRLVPMGTNTTHVWVDTDRAWVGTA
jgi:hypothetical protein